MKNLLHYHFKTYFKSYKFLLPLILYLIYLFTAYGIMPFSIVSSFSESAGVLFFIMTSVGFSYAELENPVVEQLVLLRLNNDTLYYLSRISVLLIIGFLFSLLGLLFPLLLNIKTGYHLFTRTLTVADVATGFTLHGLMAFLGAATGSFFHPRIIKSRKMALLLLFFVAVMGIAKGALMEKIPAAVDVAWIFPPVFDILSSSKGLDFFSLQATALPLIWGLTYSILLIWGQIHFLKANKF
jgi:hypothetical protein